MYKTLRLLEGKDKENRVMFVVGSLKKNPSDSNTMYLCKEVESEFKKSGVKDFKYFFLSKMDIEIGVTRKVERKDDMEEIYEALREYNIIIFATPIWWGTPSSLIQKVIERFDDIDTYRKDYEDLMKHKVFCSLVTGLEDGGEYCIARLNGWAVYLGFTLPPYNGVMWLGNKKSDIKEKYIQDYLKLLVEHAVRIAELLK